MDAREVASSGHGICMFGWRGGLGVNLANRITIARVLMTPVVVAFMLVPGTWGSIVLDGRTLTGNEWTAAILFALATGSDGLDGYIARKYHLITNFGKFLDPLADKLLICAVLVALVDSHQVPAWMTIVIVSREFAVTGLRLVAADDGVVIAAGSLGKWKTRLQVIAVLAVLLKNFPFFYLGVPMAAILLYIAVILTVVSGVDYFARNWRIIDPSR